MCLPWSVPTPSSNLLHPQLDFTMSKLERNYLNFFSKKWCSFILFFHSSKCSLTLSFHPLVLEGFKIVPLKWEVKEPTIILKAHPPPPRPQVILSILAPSYLDQLKARSLCSSQIHHSIIPLNLVQRWLNFFNCPRAGLVGGSNQWNEIRFIFDKKIKL